MGLTIEWYEWPLIFVMLVYTMASIPIIIPYKFLSYWFRLLSRRAIRVLRSKLARIVYGETQRQAAEDSNRRHPFMRLPGELRNRIYDLSTLSNKAFGPTWDAIYDVREDDIEHQMYLTSPGSRRSRTGELLITDDDHLEQRDRATYPDSDDADYFIKSPFRKTDGRKRERYPECKTTRWTKLLAMSQVSRIWRREVLERFYASNLFLFRAADLVHSRAPRHWENGFVRRSMPRFRTWLLTRPAEVLPMLKFILHDRMEPCPHRRNEVSVDRETFWRGDFAAFVDPFPGTLRTVVRVRVDRNERNLWDCTSCWTNFKSSIEVFQHQNPLAASPRVLPESLGDTASARLVARLECLSKEVKELAGRATGHTPS